MIKKLREIKDKIKEKISDATIGLNFDPKVIIGLNHISIIRAKVTEFYFKMKDGWVPDHDDVSDALFSIKYADCNFIQKKCVVKSRRKLVKQWAKK